MRLTETAVRNAKPRDVPYKMMDGGGLFLLVNPNGNKLWRFSYRFLKKWKTLALGFYPEVSLKEAREKHFAARKLHAAGIDPAAKKQEDKQAAIAKTQNTFRAVADEWHKASLAKWIPDNAERIWRRLENNVFLELGDRPINEIKPLDLLNTIKIVEKRGATDLSKRVLRTCGQIFRYAVVHGKAEYNITSGLSDGLKAHRAQHYPAISVKELPKFFAALDAVQTSTQNKLAIRLIALTFVRQGELRLAKWSDIDFEDKEWRIPAENTKMRERHIVPLAKQTIKILKELQKITGNSDYLFPSQNRQKHPIMSENTINMVIKKMGYKGQMVGHGFRSTASTALNELGLKSDLIERQLAHAPRNQVRAAYNRAEYLDERKKMMQTWADYLGECARDKT